MVVVSVETVVSLVPLPVHDEMKEGGLNRSWVPVTDNVGAPQIGSGSPAVAVVSETAMKSTPLPR
jgi:hypothetical protein